MTVTMIKRRRDDLTLHLTGLVHARALFEARGATPEDTDTLDHETEPIRSELARLSWKAQQRINTGERAWRESCQNQPKRREILREHRARRSRQQRRSFGAGAVSELRGIGRFKLQEGELDEFKRLAAQCMEIVRAKDTGTLQYDIFFNDDQSECIVLERYRDSEALIEHAAHLGDLAHAIFATGWVSSEVLGEPSAELRAMMAGSPVQVFTPYRSM
jgi:quinol monooxygenase YgiN